MGTQSIIEYLAAVDDKTNISELKINRFDIVGDIIPVDMNDLKLFPELERLTICNMMLDEDDMIIISNLGKLKYLELCNCELVLDDLGLYINNMFLEELVIDNTKINWEVIKKIIDKITIKNMEIEMDVRCNELDIHKSKTSLNILNIFLYKKMVINEQQYLLNKDMVDENRGFIDIVVIKDV